MATLPPGPLVIPIDGPEPPKIRGEGRDDSRGKLQAFEWKRIETFEAEAAARGQPNMSRPVLAGTSGWS